MSGAEGVTPEFFVSRVEHVEDMHNGCVRFWYCVDRTGPDGVRETETVCLVILPISAIPQAVALRNAALGKSAGWPAGALPMDYGVLQ